jgi:type 1 glutamine amidotransferase
MHNVLLILGGQIPAHDYPATTRVLADVLEHDGLGVRTLAAGPAEIDLADTAAAVVFTDGDFFTPDAVRRLDAYVRRGHGLVTLHTAANTNTADEAFGRLVGSRVLGGKIFRHTAHVVDAAHPLTQGLGNFELDDEVHALSPLAEYRVLVDADLDGVRQPLAYVKDEGEGRTVHLATGHALSGVGNPTWQELFRRAVRWAARAD